MKSRQELYDEYNDGKFERISHLRARRSEIEEHTDLNIPRRTAGLAEWYNANKSVIARKLNPDNEEDSEEENDDNKENETE